MLNVSTNLQLCLAEVSLFHVCKRRWRTIIQLIMSRRSNVPACDERLPKGAPLQKGSRRPSQHPSSALKPLQDGKAHRALHRKLDPGSPSTGRFPCCAALPPLSKSCARVASSS